MVRPDDSHSARSSRPKAIRSDTCSPSGSMTRNSCPRRSSKPVPLCGSILRRIIVGSGMERALPRYIDAPTRILHRLGSVPVVGEHRIDVPLQAQLAAADDLAETRELAALAQLLELAVRVENQRRPGEPARDARARRVQPDDEEGHAAEAEREPRVVRIVADRRVPAMMRRVEVV